MTDKDALKTELEFYEKHKHEYLTLYKGQFVLIKGEELRGTFTTDAEAYKAGIEQFGNQPFLIKQVVEDNSDVSNPALTIGLINTQF